MAPLYHPNLVRLFGAVWNEGPDKLCIVLEFAENGSLVNVLKPERGLTWEWPNHSLAWGVAKCMKYLHHDRPSPVMHRDIKPANILVDIMVKAKVADFGESRTFSEKAQHLRANAGGDDESKEVLTMSMVGTRSYCAPAGCHKYHLLRVGLSLDFMLEIIKGQKYNHSVDVRLLVRIPTYRMSVNKQGIIRLYFVAMVEQVYSFAITLLEIAVGNSAYVKNNTYGRTAHGQCVESERRLWFLPCMAEQTPIMSHTGLKWRPPIPEALREELPEICSLIESGYDHDPGKRPDFLTIERILAEQQPECTVGEENYDKKRNELFSKVSRKYYSPPAAEDNRLQSPSQPLLATLSDITSDDISNVEELKNELSLAVLSEHPADFGGDIALLRFVQLSHGDVVAAAKVFRQCAERRRELGISGLREVIFKNEEGSAGEELVHFLDLPGARSWNDICPIHESLCFAKNGDAVRLDDWGSVDPKGPVASFDLDTYSRLQTLRIEFQSVLMHRRSQVLAKQVLSVHIMDVRSIGIEHRRLFPVLKAYLRGNSAARPPGFLFRCGVLIGSGRGLQTILRAVHVLLPKIMEKYVLVGALNSSTARSCLLEIIEEDELPERLGGSD